MEGRILELENLKNYTQKVENELTLILQNLQWDSKHLSESTAMSHCRYDRNHKIPPDRKKTHEEACFLKCEAYTDDVLLPEPLDYDSNSLVTLNADAINEIINNAAKADSLFKKGLRPQGTLPLSLERLQCTYTADERSAIHDAVINAVPSCHDLADLALLSKFGENEKSSKTKTRLEILAELRDMKRRRTKYRVAAKTKNYSDILRDVIKTQMEVYTGTHIENSTSTLKVDHKNDDLGQAVESLKKKDSFDNTYRKSSNDKDLNKNIEKHARRDRDVKNDDESKRKQRDRRDRYKDYKKDKKMEEERIRHENEDKYNKKNHERYENSCNKPHREAARYNDRKHGKEIHQRENCKGNRSRDSYSYRDEYKSKHRESGRYEDKRPKRRRSSERYEKYRGDEMRIKKEPCDKIKRHDEIKKEIDDDYGSYVNYGSDKRIKEEYSRGEEEAKRKSYYQLDGYYQDGREKRKKHS